MAFPHWALTTPAFLGIPLRRLPGRREEYLRCVCVYVVYNSGYVIKVLVRCLFKMCVCVSGYSLGFQPSLSSKQRDQ